MYVCMCMCIYIYIYICLRLQIYIYIYIYMALQATRQVGPEESPFEGPRLRRAGRPQSDVRAHVGWRSLLFRGPDYRSERLLCPELCRIGIRAHACHRVLGGVGQKRRRKTHVCALSARRALCTGRRTAKSQWGAK